MVAIKPKTLCLLGKYTLRLSYLPSFVIKIILYFIYYHKLEKKLSYVINRCSFIKMNVMPAPT